MPDIALLFRCDRASDVFWLFAGRGVLRGGDSVILYLLRLGVNTILGDTVTGDKWRERSTKSSLTRGLSEWSAAHFDLTKNLNADDADDVDKGVS